MTVRASAQREQSRQPGPAGPRSRARPAATGGLVVLRALGNQAIQRLAQAKLRVGPTGDVHEQEADRIAHQVMRLPEPPCACGGECATCQSGRPAARPPLVPIRSVHPSDARESVSSTLVDEALQTPGQPLDAATRAFMEPRFGRAFSGVRVHVGPGAAGSAESIGARAYTVGHHVVFGAGEYRPGTADGRRLLAHELAHVTQQDASARLVQRDPKAPAKNTAAGAPKLDFQPAKNPPPCACIVFMHHNEPNARLTAQLMHELCHYNLAIVSPQTSDRLIDLPGTGKTDPNELFPRSVAEDCWADDTPCEDFLSKNAGSTKASVIKEFAERQFFLAVKKCSDGFALPVVALHNNTIDDTARYRKAVRDTKAPLDLTPIKGKTFDDSLKAGDTPPAADTLPLTELQEWLLKNVPGVKKPADPKKGALEGGPLQPGKTNIFLWCSAKDISRCHIGDPERPDNVVWVTNAADFEKLRGTRTNVVLQTRVDPAGRSATDLSSLFVFLQEIVGTHFANLVIKLQSDIAVEASEIADALAELRKLLEFGDITLTNAVEPLLKILQRITDLLLDLLVLAGTQGARAVRLSQLRFVNIETPQSPYDATTRPEDLRVQSYRDVRATLAALGLDCCEATAVGGATKSAVEQVEKALREGRGPKA